MLLALFTILLGGLASCEIYHVNFEHVYDVDSASVPSLHQKEFISSLMQNDRRRSLLEQAGFFRLHGVSSSDGTEHEFLMKAAMQHRFQVIDNGQAVDIPFAPVFNGYSVNDSMTIFAVSFPSIDGQDPTPTGMVHFSSGDHHRFVHSEEHGLALVKVDTTQGVEGVVSPCNNEDGDHGHPDEGFHEEENRGYIRKRELQTIEEINQFNNGIGTPPLLQVEVVIQSDVEFAARFPNGVSDATNYIRSFFSAINAIYERDLRASLVLQHFSFNPNSAPVTNLDELNSWLNNNPSIDALADIAVVLNGAKGGGLGYIGTFCRDKQTAHSGVNGNWGKNKWDSPNDVILTAHELGHVLGSPHTHDVKGYDPVIDACGTNTGTSSVIPADGGSIMSYCHVVTGSKGWNSMNLNMGAVGKFGVSSERVNQKIRAGLEKGQCISSPDPSWAPYCDDTTTYTWSDGSAISCSAEAAKGRCTTSTYMVAPNCMKSCGRCVTTTKSVVANIPFTPSASPVNCAWNDWTTWSACSTSCGSGSRSATRTVQTQASNGGTACSGGNTKSEACNTQECPGDNGSSPKSPVNCVWSAWSAFSACSKPCGGGTRTATRTATKAAADGGTCTGSNALPEACNTQACPPSCDDEANPRVSRGGFPFQCVTEALTGQCASWFNNAPYCKTSCGWSGCEIPCDDLVNPNAKVSYGGQVLTTCAQYAKLGYCTASWMHPRACRISCGRCAGASFAATNETVTSVDPQAEAEVVISVDSVGPAVVDDTILFDQGSSCIINNGMPSTRFSNTESGARSVDDFVVPAGKTWIVRRVQVMGNWFTSSGIEATSTEAQNEGFVPFHVTIFHGGSIQCKTAFGVPMPVPRVITLDISSANCAVVGAHEGPDGSIVMSDETYYITVSPLVALNEQFYWSFSSTKNGRIFNWRDSKDIFGLGLCPHWTDGNKCGIPTLGSDLCFQILGDVSETSELDRVYMDQPGTSNDGDGDIGSDSRETGTAWTLEGTEAEEETLQILREAARHVLTDLIGVEPKFGTIADNEQAEAARIDSGSSKSDTDTWLIPVAVTLSIMGVAVLVAVIAIVLKLRSGQPVIKYREIA